MVPQVIWCLNRFWSHPCSKSWNFKLTKIGQKTDQLRSYNRHLCMFNLPAQCWLYCMYWISACWIKLSMSPGSGGASHRDGGGYVSPTTCLGWHHSEPQMHQSWLLLTACSLLSLQQGKKQRMKSTDCPGMRIRYAEDVHNKNKQTYLEGV